MTNLKHYIPISLLSTVALYAFILNGNYYAQYFVDSGYPGFMPQKMAVFFIATELCLWAFASRKNAVSIALKYGLVLFSIFATLSSQYTSTSEKQDNNAELVYEKIDRSADIEMYREQIKIQDERINSIYRQREENLMFSRTESDLDKAEAEKAKYEKLLSEAQSVNAVEVSEIYESKTIYAWFADDLPRIFQEGWTAEFIRILFQLFSSIILAAVAPMCISMIRAMDIKKPVSEPINIIQDEIIEEPIIELNKSDKRKIITMIFFYHEKLGTLISPKDMIKHFEDLHSKDPAIKAYTLEECQAVWDELAQNKLLDTNREEAIRRICNE